MDDSLLDGVRPTDLEVTSIDRTRLSLEHRQNSPEKSDGVAVQTAVAEPIKSD